MTDYVKLKTKTEIEYAPIEKDGVINYNLDIDRMLSDGYKPLIHGTEPETNRMMHIEYQETQDSILEVFIYDETQEEADARENAQKKEMRISEIDSKIAELEQMVIDEILNENVANIQIYRDVIQGLKNTRDNL